MENSDSSGFRKKENSILSVKYKKFKGAWFDIEYPENFVVKESLPSKTSAKGSESATFTSPDKKVQFYVFSPQWNGDHHDIDIDLKKEKLMEKKVEKKGEKTIERWTIAAQDSSYTRSYEEVKDANTNKVFGIKYRNSNDLQNYNNLYLHFKKSLVQYAD